MFVVFFFSSRRRHTSCALVTGVKTCALPIFSTASPGYSSASLSWARRARPAAVRGRRSTTGRGSDGIERRGYRWPGSDPAPPVACSHATRQIGRASCRERVCQYGSVPVFAVTFKNKNKKHYTLVLHIT